MIKKITTILIVAVAILNAMNAATITESQARAIAGRFFNVEMPQRPAAMKGKGTKAAYYVFNNPEQTGWVIVAGDDRARTILAYGDEDYFDAQDVPECVQDWLNDYAEQMAHLDTATPQAGCEAPISSFAAGGRARIAPMLISNWAQGLPFNQQCPTYSNTSGETQYCPTGCVATAMAQILYYYRSSYGSIAIPAYTSEKDEMTFERPSLSATTFNYNIMNPWYDNAKNTNAGAKETARLMKYCGQSVKMDYGKNTSSATSQRNAFVYYFGFDKNARQLARTDYTAAEWENIVYSELISGRPVYISARKTSGGHAFICDGYDNGLFHINWGWRGHQNGYFALNALNDDNSGGTGAAAGDEGYTLNVQIMTGLQPDLGTNSSTDGNTVGLYKACEASATSYSRSSSSSNFTNVAVLAYYWNYSDQDYTYDLAWGLYDSNGNLVSTHTIMYNKLLSAHYYTYPMGSINVGKNITSGTYYLKPICRVSGSSTYYPCRGSGANYIKATITATNLTLQVFDEQSVQNLKINSVTTGSVKKVGSPLLLNLGVSNQGLTDYSSIFMWVNNDKISGTYTDIAPGASGTVVMTYTPSTAGSKTFKFTADEDGNIILKTYTETINSATAATISGSNITGSVTGTTFNASIKIQNTNSNTYNDYIVAKIYKKEPNSGNTGYYCGAQSKTVYLGYNNTQNLSFAFPNLEHNETYFVIFFYYNNKELTRIGATSSKIISSPYNVLDINQDGVITAADITALYDVLLGNPNGNRYRPYSDVNGDGVITAADVTRLYDHMLGGN